MLGRRFGWLWGAYAVSTFGTGLAFSAFSIIAIVVLHEGPGAVAALSAVGMAAGALMAVPLGPWVEFRRKRPVMIAMDSVRFLTMASVPVAYLLGWLTFGHLMVVAVLNGAADIAFRAASGSYLKSIVATEHLLIANGRFESTTWTATVLGPPLGGAAIGLFGPVTTVIADATSYLLSAFGVLAIGGTEERPARTGARLRAADLLDGWRCILDHPALRRLFANTILVSGLIMATEPVLSVLMLGRLGFPPWQFGLSFSIPCIGGLIGSRLARRFVARFGQPPVLRVAGALRVCWPVGLVFIGPGLPGMVLVMVVELCLITCIGVFNPVLATYRLHEVPTDRLARTLAAWQVSSRATIAVLTAVWGVLASVTGPRVALGVAGLLLLATPLLLPTRADLGGSPRSDAHHSDPECQATADRVVHSRRSPGRGRQGS